MSGRYEGDNCSREGAERLARRIEKVWLDHGDVVTCRVVPVGPAARDNTPLYGVRSDLVRGLPVRACAK